MNEEMKRMLGKFLFATVIISCIAAFFAGSTAVKEKGEYNLNLTKYAVMSFSATSQKLEATLEEDELSVSIPVRKAVGYLERYIGFTFLSPFYYMAESVKGFLQ